MCDVHVCVPLFVWVGITFLPLYSLASVLCTCNSMYTYMTLHNYRFYYERREEGSGRGEGVRDGGGGGGGGEREGVPEVINCHLICCQSYRRAGGEARIAGRVVIESSPALVGTATLGTREPLAHTLTPDVVIRHTTHTATLELTSLEREREREWEGGKEGGRGKGRGRERGREGGREGEREGGREGEREGGREGRREGGRGGEGERGREGGREGGKEGEAERGREGGREEKGKHDTNIIPCNLKHWDGSFKRGCPLSKYRDLNPQHCSLDWASSSAGWAESPYLPVGTL